MNQKLVDRLRLPMLLMVPLLATIGLAGTAGAGTTVSEVTVDKPVAFSEPSCVPSEAVVLTGTIRLRFRITEDDSGGLHLDDFYTAQGRGSGFNVVTDPGLLTPVASYTASDQQLQSTNITAGSTFENNAVFYTRVIRLGESAPMDDLYLRTQAHFTVNANGLITVDRFEEGLECR